MEAHWDAMAHPTAARDCIVGKGAPALNPKAAEFACKNSRTEVRLSAMEHAGKASRAGLKVIGWTLVGLLALTVLGLLAAFVGTFVAAISGILFGLWVLFSCFCLWFFRDPNPRVPLGPDLIVSPAHGKVDIIDEYVEPEFLGGACRRVSIFLSVFDVHVQKAPASGRVVHLRHKPGQFLNAMNQESALRNENVLVGLESAEKPGERLGIRLIAGVIARRIVPWVAVGDEVSRGERLSLIQFGSRVELYFPLSYRVRVAVGDRVSGGETVLVERV
jgi:phosphatidylserine decarboxylase